ncbi:TetR family transcriptional regulator [Haloferax sp. MBLA0076]|uniref:TetR family transcriptional regulator n=1 Tax=Haloferax litoreum TaxID=2666140 RepID=A0A6A8GJ18_9EURY|nr:MULTISPECIES: TetR/AcrR family transcriptional regulator [Haloferax]KAB1190393.1 TetR/AcrR family transcriptional regulator [Haloferax sp. CBA1148]MRX23364.1 TetR family transcriptional regulator [Haloferax litoreum]
MRGFSDEERERIRTDLEEAGRKLFAQFGLQKTTIADLTDEVNIGTSTFYRFFDSKEDLYLAVLESESEEVAQRLAQQEALSSDDPHEVVSALLHFIFDEIETNPLIRQLIVSDELDRLRAYQSEEAREEERQSDIDSIRAFTDRLVEAGRIYSDDPELVASSVAAIPYFTLHEDDIGTERYPEVRDFVIETFARGLVADD